MYESLVDISSLKLKVIGRGTFSTVYRLDDETVLIKTEDPAKECLYFANIESNRFPKLELIGYEKKDHLRVYKTKYYERAPLKASLEPREYKLYTELRKLFKMAYSPFASDYDLYSIWYERFGLLPDEFASETEELRDALGSFADWGSDVAFEISPRNVAVDNGKLILLDCFFFRSAIKKKPLKFKI